MDKTTAELEATKKARDDALKGSHSAQQAQAVNSLKEITKQQTSKKQKVEPKCEFSTNGIKLSPAKFDQMQVDGLLNLNNIDPTCHDAIAHDHMVDLFSVHPSESYAAVTHKRTVTTVDKTTGETTSTTTESPEVKTHQQRPCPDIFCMLYSFGQIYLQCYPQKTIGFLEILYYLTKYAANYPLTTFTKLEKDIREFYVTNPELTWNITRPEIQEFIHQAEYKHKKILLEAVGANPHNQATSTPAYSPAIPSSSPNAKKSF